MSGIKTSRKKEIVGLICDTIHMCINEKRLETNSDIRRCGKMIYRRIEDYYSQEKKVNHQKEE
jgi:hypothetical protein